MVLAGLVYYSSCDLPFELVQPSGQRGALRHLPQEPGHRTSDLHQPEPIDRPDHLLSATWIFELEV